MKSSAVTFPVTRPPTRSAARSEGHVAHDAIRDAVGAHDTAHAPSTRRTRARRSRRSLSRLAIVVGVARGGREGCATAAARGAREGKAQAHVSGISRLEPARARGTFSRTRRRRSRDRPAGRGARRTDPARRPSPDGLDLAMAMDGADFSPRGDPDPRVHPRRSRFERPPVARARGRRRSDVPPRHRGRRRPRHARGTGDRKRTSADWDTAGDADARFDELLSRAGVGPTDPTARERSFAGKTSGKLPETLDALVVVEGINDATAVQRAFRPRRGCRVLKGAYDAAAGHYDVPDAVVADIARMSASGTRVVVLTDSDVAGRQMRGRLSERRRARITRFSGRT